MYKAFGNNNYYDNINSNNDNVINENNNNFDDDHNDGYKNKKNNYKIALNKRDAESKFISKSIDCDQQFD